MPFIGPKRTGGTAKHNGNRPKRVDVGIDPYGVL